LFDIESADGLLHSEQIAEEADAVHDILEGEFSEELESKFLKMLLTSNEVDLLF